MSENFKDPLDELINKHKAAMGELPETVIEKKDGTVDYVKNDPTVSTVEDGIINTPEPSVTGFDESSEDIDYGDYDFEDDNEINSNLDINKNQSGFSNYYVIEEDYTTDLNQNVDSSGVVLLKEDQLMSERDQL